MASSVKKVMQCEVQQQRYWQMFLSQVLLPVIQIIIKSRNKQFDQAKMQQQSYQVFYDFQSSQKIEYQFNIMLTICSCQQISKSTYGQPIEAKTFAYNPSFFKANYSTFVYPSSITNKHPQQWGLNYLSEKRSLNKTKMIYNIIGKIELNLCPLKPQIKFHILYEISLSKTISKKNIYHAFKSHITLTLLRKRCHLKYTSIQTYSIIIFTTYQTKNHTSSNKTCQRLSAFKIVMNFNDSFRSFFLAALIKQYQLENNAFWLMVYPRLILMFIKVKLERYQSYSQQFDSMQVIICMQIISQATNSYRRVIDPTVDLSIQMGY